MTEQNSIVLDCPLCRTRVRAEIAALLEYFGGEEDPGVCVTLARCPGCSFPLVGAQDDCGYQKRHGSMTQVWSDPKRVWPRPNVNLSGSIPCP